MLIDDTPGKLGLFYLSLESGQYLLLALPTSAKDLHCTLVALLIYSIVRFLVSSYYLLSYHGFSQKHFSRQYFYSQFSFAIPFGISGGLYTLRQYSEQWIVAWLFPVSTFGVFSVASFILPLVRLLRLPVKNVLLPKMSKQSTEPNAENMVFTNSQGNVALIFFLFPLLYNYFFLC